MSTPTLVPAADRAPSLASRIVTIHATDVTEGAPAPDSIRFALPCALRVPGDDVILRPGGVTVRLVDGRAQVRLPVYSTSVQTVDGSTDWVIIVSPSWGEKYAIRVPAGTSAISLADMPAVRPLTRREQQYAITGVGVTVTEAAQAGGTATYTNGQLDLKIQVPSFRPATVYPYIDQQVLTLTDQREQEIRDDLDKRLEQVTTAYDLAVETGYEGTLSEWLDSLVGPKGADSTVPGPPNSLSVGTVTTGAPGTNAAAKITGTAPAQVLGLTIPQGVQGVVGPRGPVGQVTVSEPQPGVWDIESVPIDVGVADVTGLAARLAALEYNSGPRDLSKVAPGMTAGGWIIQRVGPWVFTNLYDVALTPNESATYWLQGGFLPAGFRPPATSVAPYVNFDCTVRNSNYSPGPLRVDRYGGVTLYGVTSKLIAVTAMWMTNDPTPTTLPGSPA